MAQLQGQWPYRSAQIVHPGASTRANKSRRFGVCLAAISSHPAHTPGVRSLVERYRPLVRCPAVYSAAFRWGSTQLERGKWQV